MGRPRTTLPLTDEQLAERYRAGESIAALADAVSCSEFLVHTRLSEQGVDFRKPGARPGTRRERHATLIERCAGAGCHNFFRRYRSQNKRYCQPACRYADPEMAALLADSIAGRHRLHGVDSEAMTATCEVCGPVHIRERKKHRVHAVARGLPLPNG